MSIFLSNNLLDDIFSSGANSKNVFEKRKNFDNNTTVFNSLSDKLFVTYIRSFISHQQALLYFNIFETHIVYNSDSASKVIVAGKLHAIPRKQVAYGDPGTSYTFSGLKVNSIDWSRNDPVAIILKELAIRLGKMYGKNFNFVLVNRYENGHQCIGTHSDDEADLGKNPTIVGISLGAERDFILHSKFSAKTHTIKLHNGSLIVMSHPTNSSWKHSVPKRLKVKKPRISLTFRQMLNS